MKIIAFDIDGTSINRFRNVSKLTIKTLIALHQSGYILVPTTGRCLNEIPKDIMNLNICNYAITSNGAKITNLKTMETIYENSMPAYLIQSLINTIDIKKWMLSIHNDNDVFDTHNFLRYARRLLFHRDLNVRPKIENISDFLEAHLSIEKIQLTTRSRQDMDYFVKKVKTDFELEMPISRGRYIEITNKNVTKLSGVNKLLEFIGMHLSDVFSIGDDMNDLELISNSGIGVAMGNANELIQSHADFVTKTNREEGFYFALKKYFPENITF